MSPTAQKLLPLMFMMMGPIGLIPKFAAITAQLDPPTARRLAARAVGYAFLATFIAALIGAGVLDAWGVSQGSLMIAAGVFLLLTTVAPALGLGPGPAPAPSQAPPEGSEPATGASPPASREVLGLALAPLAFPSIVSPYAVGVFILFCSYVPTLQEKAELFAVVCGVLALDYLAMLGARRFMATIGMTPLLILGAVFGVLQTALGVELVRSGLATW
jgi:multiple antibiotic resistance protein